MLGEPRMDEDKVFLRCDHVGCRLRRLGILMGSPAGTRHYLLVCERCGSTVSTETLRARKSLHKTFTASLSLL